MMNKSEESKNNKCKTPKVKNKKSKSKKIINIIEYIIIFLVISANVLLIFQSMNNPNKTPSLFGKKAFVIISGSMIPEIQIGDVVIINDTNDVKVGDIIAFRRDSTVIVHRIVKEMNVNGQTMYQTKGDNNNVEDKELVTVPTIEGLLIGKIPFIGKILMWLYNNLSIVIVVIIIILIIRYLFTKNEE